MQRNRFWIAMVCLALAGSEGSSAVVTSTFLNPLRDAIADEIAFVSSDVTTSNAAALRPLRQASRALGRRGHLSLSTELAQLAAASTVLLRSDYADFFFPLIDEAVLNYEDSLETTFASLASTLDTLPQSSQVLAAQRSLDLAGDLLDRAEAATTPEISTRLLSRVAVQLTALQVSIARLSRSTGTAAGGITATVDGETFTSDSSATAIFNPGLGLLTLTGRQGIGTTLRTITISLADVRPGTTTHQLGAIRNGSYAIFSQRGTNVASFTSVTGSAVINVDTIARTVTGTFSFTGASFGVLGFENSIQVSGGNLNLPLR
jgi:hypothetical protein